MYRYLILLLTLGFLISCSKKEATTPPVVIPNIINGTITELSVTPIDITTPDKGSVLVSMNNTIYKADFNAVQQSQSNAELLLASDTLLTNKTREIGNVGKDDIAYNPLGANEITILFNDGRKITGTFDPFTIFQGSFGESLIAQWRDPNDPAKPTQKANDDITGFIERYSDKDGPGPGLSPIYLFVTVSKQ